MHKNKHIHINRERAAISQQNWKPFNKEVWVGDSGICQASSVCWKFNWKLSDVQSKRSKKSRCFAEPMAARLAGKRLTICALWYAASMPYEWDDWGLNDWEFCFYDSCSWLTEKELFPKGKKARNEMNPSLLWKNGKKESKPEYHMPRKLCRLQSSEILCFNVKHYILNLMDFTFRWITRQKTTKVWKILLTFWRKLNKRWGGHSSKTAATFSLQKQVSNGILNWSSRLVLYKRCTVIYVYITLYQYTVYVHYKWYVDEVEHLKLI